jgi:GxxExxY protein
MNTDNTAELGGRDFRHLEITRRVVGVFFEVYGELGYGFLESVYRAAMTMALREAGTAVEAEMELQARFEVVPLERFGPTCW